MGSAGQSLQDRPIGVFDSGVGGLTVLRALRAQLPAEDFLYLGDTARLPYGTKGDDTVRRYALQAAQLLVDRGVKMLVIACNTASAVALEALARRIAPLPVVGVIEPGAKAACAATKEGAVLITATAGTIRGQAYQRAIAAINPALEVRGVACPVFVALAEEGWGDSEIAKAAAQRYLAPFFGEERATSVRTVVLGCTHFPVLAGRIGETIRALQAEPVVLVDSAQTTAQDVAGKLVQHGLGRGVGQGPGIVQYLATDAVERFCSAARPFVPEALDPAQVQWVDL